MHSTGMHWYAQYRYALVGTVPVCTGMHSTVKHISGIHRTGMHSTAIHSAGIHTTGMHSTAIHSAGIHTTGMHSTGIYSTDMHSIVVCTLLVCTLHCSMPSGTGEHLVGCSVSCVIPKYV